MMKRILTLIVLVILLQHANAQVRLYYKINQQPSLNVGNDCGCLRAASLKLREVGGSSSLIIDRNDEREKTGFLGSQCQEKASEQRDVNPFRLGSGFITVQSTANALKAEIYVWSPGLTGITGEWSMTLALDKSGNYFKTKMDPSYYPGCGLGASMDGEFVYVPENQTYPVLNTPNSNGILSGTTAEFSAPMFLKSNFSADKIMWSVIDNGNGIGFGTGYNFTYDLSESNKCHPIQVIAYVSTDGYDWKSKAFTFEFKPETNVNINIASPVCLESQSENDVTKWKAKIELQDKLTESVYKISTFDKDDNQSDYTLDKLIPILYKFDVDKSPYTFKIERDLGNNLTACPLWFEKIKLYYPAPISIKGSQFTDIQCFDQKANLSIELEGNTNLYTLTYGDSSKVITKNQTTNLALMTKSRSYSFEIEDENGCKYEQPINYTASEPSKLEASLLIDTAICYRGNAQVKILASGGTIYDTSNPYRYTFWPTSSTQLPSIFATKGGTTIYPRVYDKNNCVVNFPIQTLSNPKDFKPKVIEHINNICPKASLGKVILGGVSEDQNYTYTYSIEGNAFNKDSSFDSLSANTYKLTLQNQNGCKKDTSLTITQPPLIEINKTGLDSVRCFGDRNGTITLNVTGGTGFKKLWSTQTAIYTPTNHAYNFTHTYSSLADRTYWFLAQDSLGCLDSIAYAIGTRSKIQHNSSIIKPSCFESDNGQLNVYTYGGKAPYNHTWIGMPELGTSLTQTKLPKGTYILLSTDLLSCVKRDTFVLAAPPALEVNLQGYPMICKGQVAELDAGTDGSRYEWGSNNGFTSNARKVTIDKSGKYWVTIKDYNNCIGSDTITLKQSDTELKADFLVATNVVKGDTIVLVNINPIIDSIKWNIDPSYMVSVGKNLNRTTERVVFTTYGENYVEMEGYYKGCRDIRRHRVFVIDASERNKYDKAIGIKTSIINACHLFPNPNDGSFEVEFELNEKGVPLAFTLSSMATGTVLKTLDLKVYPDGKVKFEEDLPEGAYVIHVKARDEVIALRFLVAYD